MKISIELDGVALKVMLAFGLAILGCSGGFEHGAAAVLTALLDT